MNRETIRVLDIMDLVLSSDCADLYSRLYGKTCDCQGDGKCPLEVMTKHITNDKEIRKVLASYAVGNDGAWVSPEKLNEHAVPTHYQLDPEPISVIKSWKLGFCLGNVIKYIARAGRKTGESRGSDLRKAMTYLRMELEDE